MENFDYNYNTKILFGRLRENDIGLQIKIFLGTRVLLLCSNRVKEKQGLLESIKRNLDRSGLIFFEQTFESKDLNVNVLKDTVLYCRTNKINFILAVGGSSIVDFAKSLATAFYYEGNPLDLFRGIEQTYRALPIGCVLTSLGTQSHVSNIAYLRHKYKEDELYTLLSLKNLHLSPKFAIVNPDLVLTADQDTLLASGSMFISKLICIYFKLGDKTFAQDAMIESAIHVATKMLKMIKQNVNDYSAKENFMYLTSFATNEILSQGSLNDEVPFLIGGAIAVMYDIPITKTVSAIMPAWLTYIKRFSQNRFNKFAHNICLVPINFNNLENMQDTAINDLKAFYKSINMPTSLYEINIEPSHFNAIIETILRDAKAPEIGHKIKFDRYALESVLALSHLYTKREHGDLFIS